MSRPVSLSAIVLTRDEALNLPACLESLRGWTPEILVVDSGSADGTVEIAERLGARVVTHPFESHARQWEWALRSLPLAGDWILALDADQRVTPELRDAIVAALSAPPGASGEAPVAYYLCRRQIFRGRWIRHGGYYPKYLLKLFRRGEAWTDERDLVDHHFHVKGGTARLRGDLVEDNRNEADIATWIAKHSRYAALQAREEVERRPEPTRGLVAVCLSGSPDERVRWRKNQWARLPLYVRPCLYFAYRYVVRLGFLDGKQGLIFHVLQGFWYRFLVDVHIDELRARRSREAS